MEGSFWVCRAALPRAEARSSASGAYEKVPSHHARGACEVSQGFCKNRFWRSTIGTQESNSTAFQRPKDVPREARRRGEWANRALRARGGDSEKYKTDTFGGRIFWRGNAKDRNTLEVCLPHPPVRALLFPSLVVFRQHYKTAGTAPAKTI